MSKGPRKWQRKILEAIEDGEPVRLRDLLPNDFSNSQRSAIYRAARQLEKQEKIYTWMDYEKGKKPNHIYPGTIWTFYAGKNEPLIPRRRPPGGNYHYSPKPKTLDEYFSKR